MFIKYSKTLENIFRKVKFQIHHVCLSIINNILKHPLCRFLDFHDIIILNFVYLYLSNQPGRKLTAFIGNIWF